MNSIKRQKDMTLKDKAELTTLMRTVQLAKNKKLNIFTDFKFGFHVLPAHVQFSSVAQSCPTLCNPMNRSTLGLPVHHQLPEPTQTHVH